jgi:hypothetical protein
MDVLMTSNLQPGTKGGKKQLFLKEHRSEILAYYRRFGVEDTCSRYNMMVETLEKLLRSPEPLNLKDSRALTLAQIADKRSQAVSQDIERLKIQYSQFVEQVSDQLANKFFKPLLQNDLGNDFDSK